MEYILRPPTLAYRVAWLAAGFVAGSLISLAGVASTWLILLLAVLAGASGNWSP